MKSEQRLNTEREVETKEQNDAAFKKNIEIKIKKNIQRD